MKKELDMRLLDQITGGANEMAAHLVLEPVLTVDGEEDNIRWRKKYRGRPRNNTTTLDPDDVQVITLTPIISP